MRPENSPASVRLADGLRRKLGYSFPKLGPLAYRAFFAMLPAEIDVELLPGIRVRLDTMDGTQRATYWQGPRFEHPTGSILQKWANEPNSVFFDIGSNYGWFSFYLASELPHLPIHSFEPNPSTFNHLKETVDRNALRNIHPCNLGLGDRIMSSRLRIGTEDSGHSTFGAHPELAEKDSVEISIQPFDAWRQEAGLKLPTSPSWVAKIDVEGFECRVVDGMSEALQARAFRGLVIEALPSTLAFCGATVEGLVDRMTAFGYVEFKPPLTEEQANKFFVPGA
jgi:FkbM family methyltransferase